MVDRKEFATRETTGAVLSYRLNDLGVVVLAVLFSGLQRDLTTCLFTETIFLHAPPKYMG